MDENKWPKLSEAELQALRDCCDKLYTFSRRLPAGADYREAEAAVRTLEGILDFVEDPS